MRCRLAFLLVVACADAPVSGRPSVGVTGIDLSGDDGGSDSTAGEGEEGSGESGGPQLPVDCPGIGDLPFSYIWIANSAQGTVSKIDTRSGVELGRYLTSPAGIDADPSRTSVNLHGDVAVAVREPGGLTKIAAQAQDCVDADGDGAIRTSTGPQDVLPWGEDECVQWHLEIPSASHHLGPRPTAWEARFDRDPDGGCVAAAPRLWVGFGRVDGRGEYWRIDGATGAVLDTVEGPVYGSRPYGGAVDADGDFLVVGFEHDPVVRVDGETLDVTVFADHGIETYGMALDARGRVWIADRTTAGAAARLDPDTGEWIILDGVGGKTRGIQLDRRGRAWLAGNDPCRLVEVDTHDLTVTDAHIPLPNCARPVGISVDVDGYVWVVDEVAEAAYKIDPDTHAPTLVVTGLVAPYTYSDMTGAGLALVADPPEG